MKLKKLTPKKSKAQAMVEFAIALPLLMLLLYGLLEAGRLLFLYSTVVTASRQAVRYGSATGQNANGVARYNDCDGIRAAAQRVAYLGPFDSVTIQNDSGPNDISPDPYCSGPTGSWTPSGGNADRISVTVSEQFQPIVPGIVPFLSRTITATSARTVLVSVAIVVEQPPQIVVQDQTETLIDFDDPDASELNQSVTVQVTVTDIDDPTFTPTGIVEITGADTNCQITLNSNGWGSCTIVFTSSGQKTITADYTGDDEHLASSDTEDHMVTLAPTVTTIVGVAPSPSTRNEDVVVTVMVTGGSTTPTGTVDVDAGGNRNCVVTLSNGVGSCTLNFNQLGSFTITANYNGDSTHNTSSDTQTHEVLSGTATPSLTPTITPIPSITPIPTITPIPATATVTPTAVPTCVGVTHGPITKSGNTMTMTVTNPFAYPLIIGNGSVTWNDDKGHQTGADKSLRLQNITIGSTTVWTGNSGINTSSMPWTTPAIIPAIPNGTVTITFTFHQSYDNFDGTELITFNITTNGCNNLVISSAF
jgi:Flp pilus assembly protein TadG